MILLSKFVENLRMTNKTTVWSKNLLNFLSLLKQKFKTLQRHGQ